MYYLILFKTSLQIVAQCLVLLQPVVLIVYCQKTNCCLTSLALLRPTMSAVSFQEPGYEIFRDFKLEM